MKTLPNSLFFAEVERLLSEGERVVLTVQGNSMRPFIRSGRTKAVLLPCEAAKLCSGDVVLFRYRGRHILHRIVECREEGLVLAGDGNYRIEERCGYNDVVARMVTVVRRDGREISCDSKLWRVGSRCWLVLHPFIRRCILAFLWRIGVR